MNTNRLAFTLAVVAAVGCVFAQLMWIPVLAFPGFAAWLNAHDGLILAFMGPMFFVFLANWILAIRFLSRDERLSSRQRSRWIVVLVILNVFGGVLYNLRHARDR